MTKSLLSWKGHQVRTGKAATLEGTWKLLSWPETPFPRNCLLSFGEEPCEHGSFLSRTLKVCLLPGLLSPAPSLQPGKLNSEEIAANTKTWVSLSLNLTKH